jgi:hypothetical protein
VTRWVIWLALVAGCGPWMSIYHRGSPRRIDVEKAPSQPVLRWRAVRTATGVELVGKRERDVRVRRTVHYAATRFDWVSNRNPLLELLELPIGVIALAVVPEAALFMTSGFGPDTESRKIVLHDSQLVAAANPFQRGLVGMRGRVSRSDADVFVDPPRVRSYIVRLPAPRLAVRYRALDEGEQEVAAGAVTLDGLGRVQLEAVPETAIALELTAEGTTAVVLIER